jgi:hypothetical protein
MPVALTSKSAVADLNDDEKKALKDILIFCEKEDQEIRKSRIKRWQKAEQFWQGFQHIFWSDKEESWIAPQAGESAWRSAFSDTQLQELEDELGSFYDFVIDIYKAHGESIVAALSAQIPALRFIPDDADDTNDVRTARCYSKIADVVSRHNKIKLKFFRALYYLFNCGIVASYHYKDADPKYGEYVIPKYGEEEVEISNYKCPDCESDRSESPDEPCPSCGSNEPPVEQKEKQSVPVQQGTTTLPKTRVIVDIYGPLFFKVNEYATSQKDIWYLLNWADFDKSLLQEDLALDDEQLFKDIEGTHIVDNDRVGKSYSYEEVDTMSLTTRVRAWFRTSAFNKCPDKKVRDSLHKKFPKGVKYVCVGKEKVFISAEQEDFDDRWTIGQAGISTFIHSDPTGRPLVSIQEMRNQLVNLFMEHIEHGLPTSYADKEVLNFDIYGKYESLPGFKVPVKPRPGKALADSFHTDQASQLPKEAGEFLAQLDKDAQFSVGDFPSVYGGPSTGNSRTYAEYAQSRQMALQRLNILWNFVVEWFCTTMWNMVRMYVDTVVEDQRFVTWDRKNEKYINTWIRQSELQGRVGSVEPEASETFPLTLAQKHDVIMHLVELNNPQIMQALFTDPSNLHVIQDVLALNEIKMPGEDQRIKQVIEIQKLSASQPIKTMTPAPLPGAPPATVLKSTVPIDPDVDDDDIHIKTLTDFLIDEQGLQMKEENPAGYMNCIAHLREHKENKAKQGPPPIPVLPKTPKKQAIMARPTGELAPEPKRIR